MKFVLRNISKVFMVYLGLSSFNKIFSLAAVCPKNGIQYGGQDTCFWIENTIASYSTQVKQCAANGGVLAQITNSSVQSFIENNLSRELLYLGKPAFTGVIQSSQWASSPTEVQQWFNWADGQPGSGTYIYLDSSNSLKWMAGYTNNGFSYYSVKALCSWDNDGSAVTECSGVGSLYTEGNTCYYYSSSSNSIVHHQSVCSNYGGSLAVIPNAEAQAFIETTFATIMSGYVLTGISYQNVWDPTAWYNWNTGENQPDGGNVATIDPSKGYKWHDESYSANLPAICQGPTWKTECPVNGAYSEQHNLCYWVLTVSQVYSAQADTCALNDGVLAEIPDSDAYSFIVQNLGEEMSNLGNKVFLGITRSSYWATDAQTAQQWFNWESGEPSSNSGQVFIDPYTRQWKSRLTYQVVYSNYYGFTIQSYQSLGFDAALCYSEATSNTCSIGDYFIEKDLCYWLQNDRLTSAQHQAACEQNGGGLAVIPDQMTQTFIETNFAADIQGTGEDVLTGISYQRVWPGDQFYNWANGEPDNQYSSNECATLYPDDNFTMTDERTISYSNYAKPALCYKENKTYEIEASTTPIDTTTQDSTTSFSETTMQTELTTDYVTTKDITTEGTEETTVMGSTADVISNETTTNETQATTEENSDEVTSANYVTRAHTSANANASVLTASNNETDKVNETNTTETKTTSEESSDKVTSTDGVETAHTTTHAYASLLTTTTSGSETDAVNETTTKVVITEVTEATTMTDSTTGVMSNETETNITQSTTEESSDTVTTTDDVTTAHIAIHENTTALITSDSGSNTVDEPTITTDKVTTEISASAELVSTFTSPGSGNTASTPSTALTLLTVPTPHVTTVAGSTSHVTTVAGSASHVTIASSTGNFTGGCTCKCVNETLTLEERIAKIVSELKIDKTKLSSTTRKLTSAEDSRPSAQQTGGVAVAIVTAIFGGIILLDVFVLVKKIL